MNAQTGMRGRHRTRTSEGNAYHSDFPKGNKWQQINARVNVCKCSQTTVQKRIVCIISQTRIISYHIIINSGE